MFFRHLMGVPSPATPTRRIDLYGYDDHRATQSLDGEDSRQGYLAGDPSAQAAVRVGLAISSVR